VRDVVAEYVGVRHFGMEEIETADKVKGGKKRYKPTKVVKLGWGVGAEEVYDRLNEEMVAEKDVRRERLGIRVAENAVRLATIVAIGRGSKTVDREDMVWAAALVRLSFEAAVGGVEKHVREYYEFPQFCDEVEAKIRLRGGQCSKRQLERDFRRHSRTGFELGNALNQLVKEDRIKQGDLRTRGRSSPGYRLVEE
jgi:hypothetical protein